MKRLRAGDGRYMRQECPECGADLQEEYCPITTANHLICTGLIDPENENADLEACMYSAWNGSHE